MPRPIALAVILAVLGAVATAAETADAAKEPKEAKDAKEAKEAAEPSVPPWTLKDWYRTSNLVQLRTVVPPGAKTKVPVEALYLDALRDKASWVAAFHREFAYVDPQVTAKFLIESAGVGPRALGLIVSSTDSANYFALELTRTEALFYRAQAGNERVVLARRGISRVDNTWQHASVQCAGQFIRAYLNGQLLFIAESRELKPGLVGVYAAQARAEVILHGTGRPTRLAVPWQLREESAPKETPKPEPAKETPKE